MSKNIIKEFGSVFVDLGKVVYTTGVGSMYGLVYGRDWVKDNSALVESITGKSFKDLSDAEVLRAYLDYVSAKFKDVVVNNIKVEDLTPDQVVWMDEHVSSNQAKLSDEMKKIIALTATLKHFEL